MCKDNPNEYILAMRILVYFYEVLVIAGYPLLMHSDSSADFGCVQPLALFGTFFTLLSLQMPFILFVKLDNPFDAQDDIKAENLIASTELSLFQSMRCQFSAATKNQMEKGLQYNEESTLRAGQTTNILDLSIIASPEQNEGINESSC